jgi:hypothetical protein
MSTNFPTDFDVIGGNLGGAFVDAAPVVDPAVNIAADFRNTTNDAVVAMQHRIGKTDDTNPASLSWATISVGSVDNLGLRFAQEQTEWPGEVAESGIFLKDGTAEPMFHRAGEPKATFHSMLGGGGGGGSLQDAYDLGNAVVMTASRDLTFQTNPTSRFIVSNSTASTVMILCDETAGGVLIGDGTVSKVSLNGQIASDIGFDGSPRAITNNDDLTLRTLGIGQLDWESVGSSDFTVGGSCAFNVVAKFDLLADSIVLQATGGAVSLYSEGDHIELRTAGAAGEKMRLLTGTADPTSVAHWAYRGSLYLRDSGSAGELYVKQDDGSSVNWTLLGSGGGGGTLQDAYNASGNPATITMAAGKDLLFKTTPTSVFILSDAAAANFFITADEGAGDLTLGAAGLYDILLDGHISSDVEFDGSARTIRNRSASITMQTVASGNLQFGSADQLLFNSTNKWDASASTFDFVSTSAEINLYSQTFVGVRSGGGGGTRTYLLTGTADPSSVAQDGVPGSLFMRAGGVGGEVYVKQDSGSTTNWLLMAASSVSLQSAYNVGNTISTSGGNPVKIEGPEDFLYIPTNATSVMHVDGSSTAYTSAQGIFQVNHAVGASGARGAYFESGLGSGNNGWEFSTVGSQVVDRSDLDSDDIIAAYDAEVSMLGNGPGGGNPAHGAAFHARNSIFAGTGAYFSSGLVVDSSFTMAFWANTGNAALVHNSNNQSFVISPDLTTILAGGVVSDMLSITLYAEDNNATGVLVRSQTGNTSGTGVGDGGQNFHAEYNDGPTPTAMLTGAAWYLYRADGETHLDDAADAWEYGLSAEFTIANTLGGIADAGCSIVGVYSNVPETYDAAGGAYHNNDGTYTFARWAFYAEAGESKFRRTEFEGPNDLNKPLIRMRQAAERNAFYEIHGGSHPDPVTPDGNLCQTNVGAAVVGPLNTTWSYLGMYQVYVIDSKGAIPSGHYWVPLYEAI